MEDNFKLNSLKTTTLTSSDGVASVVANPSISTFNSSQKALRYVRSSNQYDVIFMDYLLSKKFL